MNDILLIWPPENPTSANSFTYHYVDFLEPLSYLHSLGYQVDFINMGLLNTFKQEMYIKILSEPKNVAIYGDVYMKNEVLFTVNIVKQISPDSKIIIFGPITSYYKEDLLKSTDCYIGGFGDFEIVLENFLNQSQQERVINGRWLEGNEFVFPNLDLFDPYDYQRLLELDRNRKQPLNIGMSISRGCGYKCTYCRMTVRDDIQDRRADIERTVSYIKYAKEKYNVNYFKLISPNFAFDKNWCRKFIEAVSPLKISWKCCTRPEYFQDIDFVKLFKESGCVSISVGLEVFSNSGYKAIGRPGQVERSLLGVKNLTSNGISVKCLVMLGVPGISNLEVKQGIELVESLGAVVRPSLYTDYSQISWDSSEFSDKRTPIHKEHSDKYLMELVYDRKGKMY